jgi:hypothetical protein
MYHNNRDGDQNPVAILQSAQPFNSTSTIKCILTRAGDLYGSFEQEFAPSLRVMLKLFCCGQGQKDSSKRVVEVALALARLAPRAVQDTFPQPSPRDLKLNFHLTLFLCTTTANMAVSTEKISVHSMAGKLDSLYQPNSRFPNSKLTLHSRRSKKHLRRRHPSLPQLPQIHPIPHPL